MEFQKEKSELRKEEMRMKKTKAKGGDAEEEDEEGFVDIVTVTRVRVRTYFEKKTIWHVDSDNPTEPDLPDPKGFYDA